MLPPFLVLVFFGWFALSFFGSCSSRWLIPLSANNLFTPTAPTSIHFLIPYFLPVLIIPLSFTHVFKTPHRKTLARVLYIDAYIG